MTILNTIPYIALGDKSYYSDRDVPLNEGETITIPRVP